MTKLQSAWYPGVVGQSQHFKVNHTQAVLPTVPPLRRKYQSNYTKARDKLQQGFLTPAKYWGVLVLAFNLSIWGIEEEN